MVNVGYQAQPRGTVDLSGIQQRQQLMEQQRREKGREQVMQGITAAAEAYEKVAKYKKSKEKLKELGIITKEGKYNLEALKDLPQGIELALPDIGKYKSPSPSQWSIFGGMPGAGGGGGILPPAGGGPKTKPPVTTKDKFGYSVGEAKVAKDGNTYAYIGNNQWRKK